QESGTVLVGDEGQILATPGVEAEVHELRELGVDAHLLTAPEVQDHFLLLDGPEMAMGFDADAGVIRADRAIQVFRDFIGGDLVTERRVERISRLPDGGFAIQVSEEEAWL